MGHGHLHRGGQVYDGFVFRVRLPYIQHRVADLQRIFRLSLGKAFRAVFERKVPFRLLRHFLQKFCPIHGQLPDGILILFEHLLPLLHGSGIIQMNHRMGSPLHGFEGFADNMFPGLGQYLDGHILRYHIPLDQSPDKLIFRIRGGRKAHLYLFKTDVHKQPEKIQFIFQRHRVDQRLIAIPQVHAAPHRRLLDGILFHPVIGHFRGKMIGLAVFIVHSCPIHIIYPFLPGPFLYGDRTLTCFLHADTKNCVTDLAGYRDQISLAPDTLKIVTQIPEMRKCLFNSNY